MLVVEVIFMRHLLASSRATTYVSLSTSRRIHVNSTTISIVVLVFDLYHLIVDKIVQH